MSEERIVATDEAHAKALGEQGHWAAEATPNDLALIQNREASVVRINRGESVPTFPGTEDRALPPVYHYAPQAVQDNVRAPKVQYNAPMAAPSFDPQLNWNNAIRVHSPNLFELDLDDLRSQGVSFANAAERRQAKDE